MKRPRTNQSGFSVVIIIAAVVAILVIGGVGFVVSRKPSDKAATSPAPLPDRQVQKSPQNADVSASTPDDPSEGGKYLVIKEWGVRVLLPSSLRGNAFYALREFDATYGHTQAADINSKFFQPECRDNAGDLSLDLIRTTTQLSDSAPLVYKRNVLNAKDYWYHNIFGKDGCAKLLPESKSNVFNELYESIGTVQSY